MNTTFFVLSTKFPLLNYGQKSVMVSQAYTTNHETMIQQSVHAQQGYTRLRFKTPPHLEYKQKLMDSLCVLCTTLVFILWPT